MTTDVVRPATILFVAIPLVARQWFTEASNGVVVAVCVAWIAEHDQSERILWMEVVESIAWRRVSVSLDGAGFVFRRAS